MLSCADCSIKVSKYRQLMNRVLNGGGSQRRPAGCSGCPKDEDVDWHEVAAGQWPELKAKQLIMHAALCDHCGPLLRAATSVNDDPSAEEEEVTLAQLGGAVTAGWGRPGENHLLATCASTSVGAGFYRGMFLCRRQDWSCSLGSSSD